MLAGLRSRMALHPRAWLDSLLSYSRFLGRIKPHLLDSHENEVRARLAALRDATEVRRLSAPIGKRLLVLAPHADDETMGAGGLLLAHRGLAEIHIINVSSGANRETRSAELARVAQTLGARLVAALNLPEGSADIPADAVATLRDHLDEIEPDVVLLPWFLDRQYDHRLTNVLLAATDYPKRCMVLGYEIWSLCEPNAVFDITNVMDEKRKLIDMYVSQTAAIDYTGYAAALARTRAFHHGGRPRRDGAVEAFVALPLEDYCELVISLFGRPGNLRRSAM